LQINGAGTFTAYSETHLKAAAAAGDTSLGVVDSTGFAAGDEALGGCVRSGSGNEGRWEGVDVARGAQAALALGGRLADGYPEPGNTVVRTRPEYPTVSIANGGALAPPRWDPVSLTGGIVAFTATTSVTVDGTLGVVAAGYLGGVGNNHDPNQTGWKTQG